MIYKVEIDGWKSNIRFSSSHILPEHEKCGVLHGHSYAIHAIFYGEKTNQDFVIDFSMVKKILRQIADKLDHKVLISEKSKYVKLEDNNVFVDFLGKKYSFPKQDCVLLPITSSTAENLADYILNELLKIDSFPSNIQRLEIGVDEGFGQGAWVEKVIG